MDYHQIIDLILQELLVLVVYQLVQLLVKMNTHFHFDSDSGSLTINIDYKDGSGDVSEFQQVVNYTKWDGNIGVDGVDGTPGPSWFPDVTYRGLWELNGEYVSSSLRRDVVQGSNGEYYLIKSSHTLLVTQIKDQLMVVHIVHIGILLVEHLYGSVDDLLIFYSHKMYMH